MVGCDVAPAFHPGHKKEPFKKKKKKKKPQKATFINKQHTHTKNEYKETTQARQRQHKIKTKIYLNNTARICLKKKKKKKKKKKNFFY